MSSAQSCLRAVVVRRGMSSSMSASTTLCNRFCGSVSVWVAFLAFWQPATPLGNSAPLWRGFAVRASSCAVQPTLRPGVVKVGLLTFLPPGETASPRKHEDLRTNLAPPLGGAFVWAPSPLRRMPRRNSAGLRSLFLRTHRVLAPSGLTMILAVLEGGSLYPGRLNQHEDSGRPRGDRLIVAVKEWMSAGGIASGPLFRRIRNRKAQRVMPDRLHHQAVSLVVKQHIRELGLEVGDSQRTFFAGRLSDQRREPGRVNFQDACGLAAREHRRSVELRARRR